MEKLIYVVKEWSKGPDDIPPLTTTTKQYLGRYCGQMEDICYIMCPGTALNHHNTEFNTSMKKVSDTELHIYALKDIHKGSLASESLFQFGWFSVTRFDYNGA